MFCIKCGTAFSWKTGKIEKGIIHNPHAHTFFENNPELADIYRNNVNGNNGDQCRNFIPPLLLLTNKFPGTYLRRIQYIYRTVAEFHQYYRNNYLTKIDSTITNNMNKDYRYEYLNKNIDEKNLSKLFIKDIKNIILINN